MINYELPISSKYYIHIIGQTAIASRNVRSITLVTQHDVKIVQKIEDAIDSKMRCLSLPEEEIVKNMNSVGSARRSVKISLLERTGFSEKDNKNHMK